MANPTGWQCDVWTVTTCVEVAQTILGVKRQDTADDSSGEAWSQTVLKGYRRTLWRKEPTRMKRLCWWVKNITERQAVVDEEEARWVREAADDLAAHPVAHACFPTAGLSPEGVSFDIPPAEKHLFPDDLRVALRRLHCNAGHPSNADLQRCIRVSQGSVLARKLCGYLRCGTCAALQAPKTPRPGKVPTDGLQFNEAVQMDLFYLLDVTGDKHWFLCAVDVATDYTIARRIAGHSAPDLWSAWCDGWLGWAGPPRRPHDR